MIQAGETRRGGPATPGTANGGRWREGAPPAKLSLGHGDAEALPCPGPSDLECTTDDIAARMRWLCEPFTFRAIAGATGLNAETIRRMLKQRQGPSLEFVTAVCRVGKVSPLWLLFGAGPVWCERAEFEARLLNAIPTSRLVAELLGRVDSISDALSSGVLDAGGRAASVLREAKPARKPAQSRSAKHRNGVAGAKPGR